MNKDFKYIPRDQRKKILLICDDIRVHSGVATVAKEIVTHTAQHFNWVQVAGSINHPDKGKILNLSSAVNEESGLTDSSITLYPVDGYGKSTEIREIIAREKPDAIMLFTDPRYFMHIWNMEQEIRKTIPITYLNIWDDYPAPMYNKAYYEACDLLMGISKQTVNINKLVLKDSTKTPIFKYLPHGKDPNLYFPLSESDPKLLEFKTQLFQNQEVDFMVYFNSRNIRRKQIPDTIMAYRVFLDSLPKEKALKCRLVIKSEGITDAGTNLYKVAEYILGEDYENTYTILDRKFREDHLNLLYNLADVQILLTSNEGWGLTITEAILAGTPIIANTTGGMQDQMRFVDEDGKWFTPSPEIPSNHRGTYKEHGEWAFPVYPTSRSIQGSPMTPYIYDDRCSFEDATERIKECYELGRVELKRRGLKGREWVMSDEAGFTSEQQAKKVIEAFDQLFDTWEPREKYELINATEYKGKFINHKIIY
jgi:glycosyltransferase involved in cell wall biosynthesis|tara:strand:- start:1394 stop:2833 length:1440 start_codon:yes stop_codon:yes gene_type:complete